MRILSLAVAISALFLLGCEKEEGSMYKRSFYIMGSKIEYKLYCENRRDCDNAIIKAQNRLKEIDYIFSNYRDDSVLSNVNSAAGKAPVEVPAEFIEPDQILQLPIRSLRSGTFDITAGYLSDLWKASAKDDTVPTDQQIQKALKMHRLRKIL